MLAVSGSFAGRGHADYYRRRGDALRVARLPMSMPPPKSLSSVLLLHELTFVLMVVLVAASGSVAVFFWSRASMEVNRVHTMLLWNEKLRGELFRQLHLVIQARLLEETRLVERVRSQSRDIETGFNELRALAERRTRAEQVQQLQYHYRKLQSNMNRVLNDPLLRGQRMRLLNPSFQTALQEDYEAAYKVFREMLEPERRLLEERIQLWAWLTPLLAAVLFLFALGLVLYSRRVVQRDFMRPMRRLTEGARILGNDSLEYRVAVGGVREMHDLAKVLNTLAQDLAASRASLVRSERRAALGALVPVIAHNIRNPLASIRATAQSMEDIEEERELKEARLAIINTTDHLGRWVNALLSYLHPLKPNRTRIRVSLLLEETLALLESRLGEKDIVLHRIAWDTPDCDLDADPALVEQALYGLLLNAVEASPRGSPLEVRLAHTTGQVAIHIRDRGPGIPFAPHAAELEPGPTTKRFGTGLGIPFAFKICEVHGWKLSFHCPEGGGTEAILLAPLPEKPPSPETGADSGEDGA